MIELLGHWSCEPCLVAKELLGKTPLEWKYIQVDEKFTGVIPRLVLENGHHIVGFPAIKEYVKKWMKEHGFPEEMI